ncbi:hypothetical protein [Streptomyces californicus]|uniref:hypothetical protein n=1 Tax=Streptomyces californicus TaxID=67351 RepID=UPI00371B1419
MPESISAVVFPDRTMTQSALPTILDAAHTGGYTVDGAVLVERNAQSRLSVTHEQALAPAETGLLKVLADMLGIPTAPGTGNRSPSPDPNDAALTSFTSFIPSEHNAILLAVREPTTDALDAVVTQLGGSIYRRDIVNILDELEATTAETRRRDHSTARSGHHRSIRERMAQLVQHHQYDSV